VRYVHSASGDLGTLEVGIGSDSAIAGIRAHFVSAATHQEVAVLETRAFGLVFGTAGSGVWRTK
jgi:hypothetical protein